MPVVDYFRTYPVRAMMGLGIFLYVVSGLLWWTQVYQTPQRAFQDMLVNNLTTRSVTKTITSQDQGSVSATVRLQFGATNAAHWLVNATQGGSSVTTESIGTPTADYVRYTKIHGVNKAATKSYQRVLNQWAKGDGSIGSPSNLFAQVVLGFNGVPTLPVGSVPAELRQRMLDFVHDESVFEPDYGTVRTVTVKGRQAYQLNVTINQAPYVRLLQSFEDAFGVQTLKNVSASQYQDREPAMMTIAIDKTSHQLVRIQYDRTGYTATYSGYGVTKPIPIPADAVPMQQLTNRISQQSR